MLSPFPLYGSPYDSHQSWSKHTKKNIFDYVRWSAEQAFSNEDDVIKHYDRFLDLAEPLLDSQQLDDKECDILFWYGFHPEDRAMLLYQLLAKRRNPRSETYFPFPQVFRTARAIFSLGSKDFQRELDLALERYPIPRGPYDYRRDPKRRPSLSKYRAEEIVQKLEARLASRRKERKIENSPGRRHSPSIYESEEECANQPRHVQNTQPPSTSFTRRVPLPPLPPSRQSQSLPKDAAPSLRRHAFTYNVLPLFTSSWLIMYTMDSLNATITDSPARLSTRYLLITIRNRPDRI